MSEIGDLIATLPGLTPGLEGRMTHLVRPQDLADAWQGEVSALASAPVIWLAELACMRAVAAALPPGHTTVGVGFDLRHLAPTPAGVTIEITARLNRAIGRSLLFEVRGTDGAGIILDGRMTRHVAEPAVVLQQMTRRHGATRPSV